MTENKGLNMNLLKKTEIGNESFIAIDRRSSLQKKTFSKWFNAKLKSIGMKPLGDLFEDLGDGIALYNFFKSIGKNPPQINKSISLEIQKYENLKLIFDFMKLEKIKIINIGSEDIINKNGKLILGLIWALILYYSKNIQSEDEEGEKDIEFKKKLLTWCKNITKEYKGVNINDFAHSWSDGKAFNAILHSLSKVSFNFDELMDKLSPRERLTHAFQKGKEYLGIEMFLEVSDLLENDLNDKDYVNETRGIIDEKCVITYILEYYRKAMMMDKQSYYDNKLKLMGNNFQEYQRCLKYYDEVKGNSKKINMDLELSKSDVNYKFNDLLQAIEKMNINYVKSIESSTILNTLEELIRSFESICHYASTEFASDLKNETSQPDSLAVVKPLNIDNIIDIEKIKAAKDLLNQQELSNFEQLTFNLQKYICSIRLNSDEEIDYDSKDMFYLLFGKNPSESSLFNSGLRKWMQEILSSVNNLEKAVGVINMNRVASDKYFNGHSTKHDKNDHIGPTISGEDTLQYISSYFKYPEDILKIDRDDRVTHSEFTIIIEHLSVNSFNKNMLKNIKELSRKIVEDKKEDLININNEEVEKLMAYIKE